MKKAIAISLGIFILAVLAIFVYSLIPPPPPVQTNFSPSDVSKHNSASDCWLIIAGKVYDVSKYLDYNLHPGDSSAIAPYCGKDASNAFDTKGRNRPQPHSSNARNILSDYYIGSLSQ